MTMKPIPKSLLNLLADVWKPATEANGRAFDQVFEQQDRRRDPSFYFNYEGSRKGFDAYLSFKESAALIRDGVFCPPLAALYTATSGERQTSTNEHAQHAVIDFCEEVYAAWQTLQNRLDQVAQACPIHPRDRQ